MFDIASLFFNINSQGVAQATSRLDAMARSSAVAEAAAGNIQRTWGGLYRTLASIAAGAGAAGLALKAITTSARFERVEKTFEGLTGSAETAKKMMEDLRKMAETTPIEFEGLAENAKFMSTMGFTAKEIIPDLKILTDTVGAMGGDSGQLNRIVLALGQIRQMGRVQSQEMRQLANANVGAWESVAKALGVTVPEAMKRAEEGTINAEVAIEAILKGMEQKFGGQSARMAQTLSGAWTIFQNNVTFTLKDVGDEIARSLDLVGLIKKWTTAFRVFSGIITDVMRVLGGLEPKNKAMADTIQRIADAVKLLVDMLKIFVAIKIVTIFTDMTKNAILFARSMGSASIATTPLLAAVLAVGVGLAAWSLGKTFIQDLQWVQKVINKVGAWMGKPATPDMFQMGISGLDDPKRKKVYDEWQAQLKNYEESNNVDEYNRINRSDPMFQGGTGDFMKDFKTNLAKTVNEGGLNLTGNFKELLNLLPGTSEELKKLTAAYEQLTDTRNNDNRSAADTAELAEKQLTGMKAAVAALLKERETLAMTSYQRTVYLATKEAEQLLQGTAVKDKERWIQLLKEETIINEKLKATTEIGQQLEKRRQEANNFSLHGEDLRKEVAYRQLVNKALEDGVPLTASYLGYIRAQSDALDDLEEAWKRVWAVADDVGQAFATAFEDAIFQAKGLKEIMLDLIKTITQSVLRQFVTGPMAQGISSLFGSMLGQGMGLSATGQGATGGIAIPKSANGNVFDRPSLSIFGEAGPETVLPLTRGANGKLGVQSHGGGGRSVNVYMTVYANDASSFKKSNRQISQDLKRKMS